MPVLQVQNLSKHFGGLKAVEGLSFDLSSNEILALIGPNGAGKTTAINLISGTYFPDSGDVVLSGKSVVKMRPHDRCRMGLARTFQRAKIFSTLSIYENSKVGATFGRPASQEAHEELIDRALHTVGLVDRQDAIAESLNTANKKKLQIAIALAANPTVLLLDEPMAGLSLNEIQEFQRLIKDLRDQGMAILIVEHLMEPLAEVADRAIVMNEGRKLIEGTLKEVLNDARVINAYLGQKYAGSK